MPLYTFSGPKGKEDTFFFTMDNAPRIGSVIERKGTYWVRMPDIPNACVRKDTHFVSNALPRNAPGAKHYTDDGKPAFSTKSEVGEFIARSEGDWVYDN